MAMSRVVDGVARRTIASFDTYEEAQELVDRLADDGFPVDRLTIVGRDVQLVEQVTGRLNWWRAALYGLVTGAVVGGFLGLLFDLIFSPDDISLLGVFLFWLAIGAVVGAILGLLAYAASGGQRDFTSVSGLVASRYDVMAEDEVAEEALRRLAAASSTRAPRQPGRR